MTDTTRAGTAHMPSIGRLLAAQISYQARLLASGRAITIGVGLPIILLIASHASHTQTTDADVAQYAVFGLTLTAWNTYGVRLVAARESGVLKRWKATPLPRWTYFLGRILATVVVATIAGAATVAAGVLLYHTDLSVTGALGTLVAFILGSFAWAATATALTAVVPTLEAAAPTFLVTYFPIIVVSGVFGSISEPHWLSTIASYLPAAPLAHAATAALGHTAGQSWIPARDLAVLAAWAITGMAIAPATFRWEPHRPTQKRPPRPPRPANAVTPQPASGTDDGDAATTDSAARSYDPDHAGGSTMTSTPITPSRRTSPTTTRDRERRRGVTP
jgi:ABC-2 type transport system permease protein